MNILVSRLSIKWIFNRTNKFQFNGETNLANVCQVVSDKNIKGLISKKG